MASYRSIKVFLRTQLLRTHIRRVEGNDTVTYKELWDQLRNCSISSWHFPFVAKMGSRRSVTGEGMTWLGEKEKMSLFPTETYFCSLTDPLTIPYARRARNIFHKKSNLSAETLIWQHIWIFWPDSDPDLEFCLLNIKSKRHCCICELDPFGFV